MSSSLPTVTFEPKPPPAFGHRNPMIATPNAPSPADIRIVLARLKNWRRLTPIASASGGTNGAGRNSLAGSSSP